MKCKIIIFAIILICVSYACGLPAAGDDDDVDLIRVHPGFKNLFNGIVMTIQMGIFGNCGEQYKAGLMDEADKEYVRFIKCSVRGVNEIATQYNFPSEENFDVLSFQESPEYPIYVCKFYEQIHLCIPEFLPYLAMCLNNYSAIALKKMHTATKPVLDYGCENNAAVFLELFANQNDRCVFQLAEKVIDMFKTVVQVDEEEIFTTPTSCKILASVHHAALAPQSNCTDSINTIIDNGFHRFWNLSGCSGSGINDV